MKKNILLYLGLLLMIMISGCSKLKYDDVSFVNSAANPAQLSAMFDITQDNTGLVTIYPNGEGVAYYQVSFGDATTTPVKVMPGGNVQHTYSEGQYNVKVVGVSTTGKLTEATQQLTVSFRAPENVEVTTTVDESSPFKINLTAKGDYETLFKVYWGVDPNETPVSVLEGSSINHMYATSGTYTITVVALSGGAASTTVTKEIVISVPLGLPLDFQTVGQTYTFNDFDGGQVSIVNNPDASGINTSSKVGKMVKNPGQTWGGSMIALTSPIDFSTNKIMRMKVHSPRVGAKVLLKVENLSNGGINFEKEVLTTKANQWEELVFDYRSIDVNQSYSKVVLIFDNGTAGDGTSNFTFYFDDLKQSNSVEEVALPLSFESAALTYDFTNFGGANASVVNNPDQSGVNTSDKVGKLVKGAPEVWAGSYITLANPINFSTKKFVKIKVHSPRVGAKLLLKVENLSDGGIFHQKELSTSVANGWEELVYDFTDINTSNSYQKVVLIFDNGTSGDGSANYTFYFDDIIQTEKADELGVPMNFESSTLSYNFVDFGGAGASVVANPSITGINKSNKVGKMVKGAPEVWAGSLLELPSPIDFSEGKTFKVKVFSPRVDAKLLLKVENKDNNNIFFQKEVATTKSGAWEELTFDYSEINTSNSYHKIVLIFDLGTTGDGSANYTYYFDDINLTNP